MRRARSAEHDTPEVMPRTLPLAFLLLSGAAFAQENVRFRYHAPPECPTEREFREQVNARMLRHPESETPRSEGAEDLDVEVRLDPSQRSATLRIQEPGAPAVERRVEGDSCAELASGLAMITALAFGAAEETAVTAAEPARSDEPAAEASPQAQTEPPKQPEIGAASEKSGKNAAGGEEARPSQATPLGMEVGVGGWLNTWSAPDLGLGADVFVRVAPRSPGGWSLRLAGLYGFGASYVGDRLARFTLLGGRAEGCPFSRGLTPALLGEGCVALDAGALTGRGEDSSALLDGSSETVFWAAAVVVARLRARFGARLSVEAQGELGLPLVRHEFVFEEPRERIFRVPPAGVAARVGVGVQFL
jgi:hypothetical protein